MNQNPYKSPASAAKIEKRPKKTRHRVFRSLALLLIFWMLWEAIVTRIGPTTEVMFVTAAGLVVIAGGLFIYVRWRVS